LLRLKVPFCMHRKGWFLILFCFAIGVRMSGWQLGLLLGVLLLASILLHEISHLLTATLFRVPMYELGIKPAGAYIRRAPARRRRDEILIAASGPMVNLLIVIPLIFVPKLGYQIAMCNLVIGVVNLLPLPSSDGLRVLRNLAGLIPTGSPIPARTNGVPSQEEVGRVA
jgi:Zn-dependent protease